MQEIYFKSSDFQRRAAVWFVVTLGVLTVFASSGTLPFPGVIPNLSSFFQKSESVPLSLETAQSVITIPALGISSTVIFPHSADLAVLEQALDRGVVHYPFSAVPNAPDGNVFIFGHSSARLFESNPARTVFTKLNRLEPGNDITLSYAGKVYLYKVHTVKIFKPWEAEVYFETKKRMLTLSTCWPVGDPSNRFVVEAEFVKSYPLVSS